MEIILALSTGFFLGSTAILIYLSLFIFKLYRKVDAERMLLLNKAFVRDGQSRLFTDEMIAGNIEAPEEKPASAPMVIKSPFQAGLAKKREEIEKRTVEKEAEGSNLPDGIKEQIRKAAEEMKAKEAA